MIYSEMQPDELNECLELDDMFEPSLQKFKIVTFLLNFFKKN